MMKKIKCKKEKVLLLLNCICLAGILTYKLDCLHMITVLYDEFGYWATAAMMNELDWKSVVSGVPYYSYGYGLILYPIIKCLKNPLLFYPCAIIVNIVFILASFLLLYYIFKRIFKNINEQMIMLFITCAILYPSVISNSQIAWSEILMTFIFICIVAIIKQIEIECHMLYCILLSFLLIYLYTIHQRNIGVIIASVSCMLTLYLIKKINKKQLTAFVFIFLIGIVIQNLIKNYFVQNLWYVNQNSTVANINDYSGQVDKIKAFFTIDGFIIFITNVLGRLYYFMLSSFGIIYFGIKYIIEYIINSFSSFYKKKTLLFDYTICYLFLLTSFVFSILISSVYMIIPSRTDMIIYGRYTEYLVLPFIILGLYQLIKKDNNSILDYIGIIFFEIVVSVYLLIGQTGWELGDYASANIPAVINVFRGNEGFQDVFCFAIFSIFITCLICVLKITKRKKNSLIIILLLCNLIMDFSLLKNAETSQGWYKKNIEAAEDINKICELVNETRVVCIDGLDNSIDGYWYQIPMLQFLLYDKNVEIISSETFKKDDKEDNIIVVTPNKINYGIMLKEDYNCLEKVSIYNIYVSKKVSINEIEEVLND